MKTYPFIVAKPETEVISLQQAREWLNMDIEGVTFADGTIKDLLAAAIDYVETEINASLGVSTYEWYPECFPTEIPDTFYVKELVSIANSEGDIDVANYSLIKQSKRRVKIKWIDTYDKYDRSYHPYKVMFKAGIPAEEIPPRLKQAIRVLIAAWYNPQQTAGDPVVEKRTLSDKLIAPYVIGYA